MNLQIKTHRFKRWEIIKLKSDGVPQIITHVNDNGDFGVTITCRQWKRSKYRIIHWIRFMWLKLMVWLKIY